MSKRNVKYPFDSMNVGSSFIISSENQDIFQHCRVAANKYKGKRFKTRTMNDGSLFVKCIEVESNDIATPGSNVPTYDQFSVWLRSFTVGQRELIGLEYIYNYPAFVQWIALYTWCNAPSQYRSIANADGSLTVERCA